MRKTTLSFFLLLAVVTATFAQQQQDSIKAIDASAATIDLLVKERLQLISDSLEKERLRVEIENTKESSKRRALEADFALKMRQDSLRVTALKAEIEHNKINAIGYPVVVDGDTIRLIYTKLGSLTASERADLYSDKIREVSPLFIPAIDSLSILRQELNVEILLKDKVLTTISLGDALWADMDIMDLATEVSHKTREVIIEYRQKRSTSTIIRQIVLSILVVAISYILIRIISKSFRRRLTRFVLSKRGSWFKGLSFKDYQILNSERQVRAALFLIKALRWAFSLFVIYIALPILFSIFPLTQRLADTLFGWVFGPVKSIFWATVEYLPNLFIIVIIWLAMRYVVRGLKYIMNEIEAGNLKIKGFFPDWAKATGNILSFLLYAFTFVMIFPYLPGSDSDVFKGVSVFLGILVSLGSSSALNNLVSGLVITYMRPFKIGDHIRIGDLTGDVIEKTPFVTRIKTYRQEIVTMPNSAVLAASVINFSTSAVESGVIFHVTITIGYDVPWRQVHSMMIEAALSSPLVLREPAPFVLQTSLDDFYVSYQVCAYSRNPERQATIYSQINQGIQDVFNREGVEIMSAHYRAERDGNCTTIPEDYRPKDYSAPTFVVTQKKEQEAEK